MRMKQRRLQYELAGLFVGTSACEQLHTKDVVEVSVLCSRNESGNGAPCPSLDEVCSASLQPVNPGSCILRLRNDTPRGLIFGLRKNRGLSAAARRHETIPALTIVKRKARHGELTDHYIPRDNVNARWPESHLRLP